MSPGRGQRQCNVSGGGDEVGGGAEAARGVGGGRAVVHLAGQGLVGGRQLVDLLL